MWYDNLIGMFLETLLIVGFLRLFSDSYNGKQALVLAGSGIIAIIDTLQQLYFNSYVVTFTISVSCILLWLKWMTKRSWSKLIFEFLMTYIFIAISQFSSIWIVTLLVRQPLPYFVINLISLALLIAVVFCTNYPSIQCRFRMCYEKTKSILYLIAVNFFIISFMELYLWNTRREIFNEEIGLVAIVLAAWGIMNFLLLKRMLDNQKQEELLSIHKSHIDVMETLLDQLHGEKHEFRKHLQTVLGLAGVRDDIVELREIREYINGWQTEANLKQDKRSTYLTGNRVVNALLDVKHMEAVEAGITLLYIPNPQAPEFHCDEHELVEIIGNLLSNAFEAVMPLQENKTVSLEIGMVGEKVQIQVKNKVSEEVTPVPEKLIQKGYSTKTGAQRGYGLYRVHQIVKKYNGTVSLSQQEDWFIAEILF